MGSRDNSHPKNKQNGINSAPQNSYSMRSTQQKKGEKKGAEAPFLFTCINGD